ncbi:hypothetical protein TNCV_9331 [Trichonephila clavipes]|nr:hypothetical protein TNCV_9331 [Trichonephila clavipes]
MNCRGQAYDNAVTMAGCYTGVQTWIKDINPNDEFVPCSNNSLNLVGVHAPSVELQRKHGIYKERERERELKSIDNSIGIGRSRSLSCATQMVFQLV